MGRVEKRDPPTRFFTTTEKSNYISRVYMLPFLFRPAQAASWKLVRSSLSLDLRDFSPTKLLLAISAATHTSRSRPAAAFVLHREIPLCVSARDILFFFLCVFVSILPKQQ